MLNWKQPPLVMTGLVLGLFALDNLLVVSQILYAFVAYQLPKLLKRTFNPGFSAFTFPFVISATSLKLAFAYLELTSIWKVLI